MLRQITIDEAIKDLTKVSKTFSTIGDGRDIDRLAQLVIQPLQVLQQRLNSPTILKIVYLNSPEATKVLPQFVLEIVQALCDGKTNGAEAKEQLNSAIEMYQKAFAKMGITPQQYEALFIK